MTECTCAAKDMQFGRCCKLNIGNWKIKVISYESGEVVKTLEATNERLADRIDGSLNINLNQDLYYTLIEPPKDQS